MAILKCKMCGGDIEVSADKTYGTCDSCGSTMTLPKIDSDQRANLYNRANHFRRQNEFDKALAVYEKIIVQNDSEAEAHWGAVLCRFGIEYVEDPVSHERIPTCHRASYDSILQDVDYLAALTHSDDYTKSLYEKEATYIAGVQKDIVAISQQEKPYDVFICYKETDAAGNRTKDSALAQDVYYQLTQEGYKVFFSRITLEDKLGQAYEPYIFAALNSAKVMVVIGTKAEYYNAVWVKNEWSRYLNLLKTDKSRLLIPCYRDMDAYDLPEELSMLQSQDMGKIGFVQDLVRGIHKVFQGQKKADNTTTSKSDTDETMGPALGALLKRGQLFLGDEDWEQAQVYFNRALDLDPESAEAYIGLVCVDRKYKGMDQLGKVARYPQRIYMSIEKAFNMYYQPILDNKNYQKALKFATPQFASKLQDLYAQCKDNTMASYYGYLTEQMNCANTKETFAELEKAYHILGAYSNASALEKLCHEKYLEYSYSDAMSAKETATTPEAYLDAGNIFKKIADYKDSKTFIAECEMLAKEMQESIQAEKERIQLEQEQTQHEMRLRQKAKAKKTGIITGIVTMLVIAVAIVMTQVVIPSQKYATANELLEDRKFEEASSAFLELGNYKDSAEMAQEVTYQQATYYLEELKYDDACEIFTELGDYADSADMSNESLYLKGMALFNEEDYFDALNTFDSISGYKDSATYVYDTLVQNHFNLLKDDLEAYDNLAEYSQSEQVDIILLLTDINTSLESVESWEDVDTNLSKYMDQLYELAPDIYSSKYTEIELQYPSKLKFIINSSMLNSDDNRFSATDFTSTVLQYGEIDKYNSIIVLVYQESGIISVPLNISVTSPSRGEATGLLASKPQDIKYMDCLQNDYKTDSNQYAEIVVTNLITGEVYVDYDVYIHDDLIH